MTIMRWKCTFIAGFALILCLVFLVGCQTVSAKSPVAQSIHEAGTPTFIINGCTDMDEMLSIAKEIDAGAQATEKLKSCWKSTDGNPIPAVLIELIAGPYRTPFGTATVWQVLDSEGDISFTMIPEKIVEPMSAPENKQEGGYIRI